MLTSGIACSIRPAEGERLRPNSGADFFLKKLIQSDVPLMDVEYVDDGAFMFFAASPSTLLSHVTEAAAVIENLLTEHGVEVNWVAKRRQCVSFVETMQMLLEQRLLPIMDPKVSKSILAFF
jgi:hypothetical protein